MRIKLILKYKALIFSKRMHFLVTFVIFTFIEILGLITMQTDSKVFITGNNESAFNNFKSNTFLMGK